MGLAYMVTTPQSEAKDRFSNFDFYTGEIFVGGTIGVKTDWSNIQPRIGFAWSPGAEHDHGAPGRLRHLPRRVGDGRLHGSVPRTRPTRMRTPSRATTSRRFARLPRVSPSTTSRSIRPITRGAWTTIDPNYKQGRVQQWSLNIERMLSVEHRREHCLCRLLRRSAVRQDPQPEHGDAGTGIQPGGPSSVSAVAEHQRRPQPRLDEVQLDAAQGRAARPPAASTCWARTRMPRR